MTGRETFAGRVTLERGPMGAPTEEQYVDALAAARAVLDAKLSAAGRSPTRYPTERITVTVEVTT